MSRYLQFAAVVVCLFALLAAMARLSGPLLLPVALAVLLGLGYVAVRIAAGGSTPYPRLASDVVERTETERIELSDAVACESCTDDEGVGERRTTYRDLVFLGVPLVRLSTVRTVRCELCADPLGHASDDPFDAVDRELDRDR
ncbi:hypothetical protein ACFQE1_06035 [Halobium palmae]|uniref:DUF8108 domain-containing protein n=1 Tax=Halobium palmae TaxID=1776492 RepID=A0ABD5RX03_9EURY